MQARAVLAVGDVRLDPVRFTVTRGGQFIELGTREFAVLEVLMRHAGETLTRGQIVAAVWGAGHTGSPKIVDVHVRRLRAAMDDHFPTKMIKTERGSGYKLVAR